MDRGNSPACAGSTGRPRSWGARTWEQPRVRGEHAGLLFQTTATMGTAPRTRGARRGRHHLRPHVGNSPACAESTAWCRSPPATTRDQPRVRGEHTATPACDMALLGSARRARGARLPAGHRGRPGGISPACAGSTRPCRTTSCPSRGSAPRARGARPVRRRPLVQGGISPACAGSTRKAYDKAQDERDQPRVRGEHS